MEATFDEPARSHRFRFGMRAIFVALTATCLILAPAQWFGGFYLVSAGFSVALVLICSLVYRTSGPAAIGLALLGAFVGLVAAVAIIVFFFHAAANVGACLVLTPFKPRPRTFALVLVGVMLAVYSVFFYHGYIALQEVRGLQRKYPLVSLVNRLSFERPQPEDSDAPEPPKLDAQVAGNLNTQEQAFQSRQSWFSRAGALEQLHENYQAEFSRAAGFGNLRMDSISYRIVSFEPLRPLSLPMTVTVSKSPASNQELYNVHRAAAQDFVSADRIGYIKSRDAVAGFESHQLTSTGDLADCTCGAQKYWQIVRLELVGLLQSDEPRVYTAKILPPMDKIAETPHRELNDFEKAALPRLISQNDVEIDSQPDRIQMLGALRAGTKCLECHQGERGKLLGAFSYELVPVSDEANKSAQD